MTQDEPLTEARRHFRWRTSIGAWHSCTPDVSTCTPGIRTCTPDIHTCTPDIHTCTPDISTCTPDIHTCTPDIRTCTPDIYTCTPDIYTCTPDLPCEYPPLPRSGAGPQPKFSLSLAKSLPLHVRQKCCEQSDQRQIRAAVEHRDDSCVIRNFAEHRRADARDAKGDSEE